MAVARGVSSRYDDAEIRRQVRALGERLGWADERSAFGRLVPPGARVLAKPNLVTHRNQGTGGILPLVTHASVIAAVVEELLLTDAASITLGDAPVQGCDFDVLLASTGLGERAATWRARDARFSGVEDFRRTVMRRDDGVQERERRSSDDYVLYDTGARSLLEPVTGERPEFRVTMYDPRALARTHQAGRHQYLVASPIANADVVVNLPKLKTHKKAGVTCALKNLVGINGNKEFLPHHRIGSPTEGGDCYPEQSLVKRTLERSFDAYNTSAHPLVRRGWRNVLRMLDKARRMQGDEIGVEGAWHGNDTVWRMCLDLNRVLLYGDATGIFREHPVRRVVNLVDAVIAGDGDGPLASDPLDLGVLLAGESSAATDWVGALLLDCDPARIPIIANAFTTFDWPLVTFPSSSIDVLEDNGSSVTIEEWCALAPEQPRASFPAGWENVSRAGDRHAARKSHQRE